MEGQILKMFLFIPLNSNSAEKVSNVWKTGELML